MQPPRQEASASAAFVTSLDARHAHALGNPPRDVALDTHCISALQPTVMLHVATALDQSLHLIGLHEQTSKPPSPSGPASAGEDDIDDALLDAA